MNLKLLFTALLFSLISYAQVPAGYYSTATGTGYTLKTNLYNIIKGHIDNGYGGLYTTYQTSDIDNFYENDGTVLDMYSENPTSVDPYNYSIASTQRCGNYSAEGDCYNREHIIPQSVFGSNAPMVSDAHSITPTDGKVNGMRSNYPHGTVGSVSWTSKNGSKLGSSAIAGYSGNIFEPLDEFKGDIARMYFYFATRYENTVAGYSFPMFNGTTDQVFTTSFLNMLLTWHAQDPVNAREITRNNAIYARQNNRNPYIDHPEYVQAVWNPVADTQTPTAATNLVVTGTTSSSVSLSWTAGTDNVAVTSYDIYMDGVLKTSVSGVNATITGLSATTSYTFYVIAKDAAVNSSLASNSVNGTTTVFVPDTQNPTTASNLAVTGSSSSTVSLSWIAGTDNIGVTSYDVYLNSIFKSSVSGTTALVNGLAPTTTYSFYVIAKDAAGNSSLQSNSVNGTTTVISTSCASESFENIPAAASSYTLPKTWTGDSGLNWTATDARTDEKLNTTRAICIRNGSLSASTSADGIGSLTVTTQLRFTGTSGTFNLRVNGNIVGTIPYSTTGVSTTTTISGINIAGDVVISITDNSTATNRVAFDDLSWTCFSGLGLETLSQEDFKIYPNPSKGNFNILFDDSNGVHSVAIFSLLGQKVFEKSNTQSSSILVTNLPKGTYLLKVTKDSKSTTKKIIIN
ncbi:endonuclease [Flavobacterium franklandianum]|uniref:T9SS type A sorting domain-containing protein n=1 Tax=Flavobacterium franklandianum TaxID=2594430 RepID=A0A553C830_9FLAO|nr:endonuclease [Flavobacterium franklandianum]TRX16669.1 T9SS type A sorting domain-containing protein [Flavobacterium franklandianum]